MGWIRSWRIDVGVVARREDRLVGADLLFVPTDAIDDIDGAALQIGNLHKIICVKHRTIKSRIQVFVGL